MCRCSYTVIPLSSTESVRRLRIIQRILSSGGAYLESLGWETKAVGDQRFSSVSGWCFGTWILFFHMSKIIEYLVNHLTLWHVDDDDILILGWWFGTFWFYFSHILGIINHPNWRTHIFQRGRYTTNQVYIVCIDHILIVGVTNFDQYGHKNLETLGSFIEGK